MYVLSVTKVSEYDQVGWVLDEFVLQCLYSLLSCTFKDYTIEVYFRQYWHDERLAFDPSKTGANDSYDKLIFGQEMADNLWVPDTVFINEKKTEYHEATVNNNFIQISSNGDVMKAVR